MDGNWRWLHGVTCSGSGLMKQCSSSGNCYTAGAWDKTACADPESCGENCAVEAVTAQEYESTYGVKLVPGGVQLNFVSMGAGGMNVGSRLYLMDTESTYKLFKLKNREFTFDVDVSTLPCGMNGAVYFSEMQVDGGFGGRNKAGAKYGTGYCDAQCPHDIKFMAGDANILDWNTTSMMGRLGACCAEMDLWEANKASTAFTAHPCTNEGLKVCEGTACGDTDLGERYAGYCDKDGCDFNSYRMGDHSFLGEGPGFTVDTTKPITVVTQWLTDDGTDFGDLSEIRRLYVQDGKIIKNSIAANLADYSGDSITEEFCVSQKRAFGDPNDFAKKGGLKAMGEALNRGMVLVLSLWDDHLSRMLWLDSNTGNKKTMQDPGQLRGPCPTSSGLPADLRSQNQDAYVRYTNIMYGEIDSTYVAGPKAKPDHASKGNAAFAERLRAFAAPAVTQQQLQQERQQKLQQQQQLPQQQVQQPQQQLQQPSASSSSCGAAFSQCGGQQWNGATCCESGCTCQSQGSYYAQCAPPAGQYSCGGVSSVASTVVASSSSSSGGTSNVQNG